MHIRELSLTELALQAWNTQFFQAPWYSLNFITHFSRVDDIVVLGFYHQETLVGYVSLEIQKSLALLVGMKPVMGKEEVTDYGDISLKPEWQHLNQEVWPLLLKELQTRGIKTLQLDYLTDDSLAYQFATSSQAKPYNLQINSPEKTSSIIIKDSWEMFLTELPKKKRNELNRKLRRLEGVPHAFSESVLSHQAFSEFVKLHQLSSSSKEQFFSKPMQSFFWSLITTPKPGWKAHLYFLAIQDKLAASVLTFENQTEILAYNSGFDPQFSYYSAGLLLHQHLLQKMLLTGQKSYNFLRGTERYKSDLGAQFTDLYQVTINLA